MIALPVLWVYGASGVGKTTVTWELFTQLVREGVSAGYVDIDQLGMCYGPPMEQERAPEPATDPGRHRLKARALDAVVANFRDAGVRCVIVPGVTDMARGVETRLVPNAALTTCRLRADSAELQRRLGARGGPSDDFTWHVDYADALDRGFANELCVDTTGLAVAQVVDQVRARTGWPDLATSAEEPSRTWPRSDHTRGEILWLCGPTAVGKSTVGWQVYQQVRQAGVSAAFVDLDQIGFQRPVPASDPGNHRLKAANLAALWHVFRASTAQCLVMVGPLEHPQDAATYAAALPAATMTLCRLQVSRQVLANRVARRARGPNPAYGVAGDELIGQPRARLDQVVDRAARTMDALDGFGNLGVDTDDQSPDEVAAEILRRTGWPSRPR